MSRDSLSENSDSGPMRGFLDGEKGDKPEVFIQWKGTVACFDLNCDCGHHNHYDAEFAYVVKCGGCGQLWEMPCLLYPRKAEDDGVRPVEPNA